MTREGARDSVARPAGGVSYTWEKAIGSLEVETQ